MSTICELIILGTGGNAYDLIDIVDACNALEPVWKVVGFLDDVKPAGTLHCGLPVFGRLDEAPAFRLEKRSFINAIGSDESFRHRETIIAKCGLSRDDFATLVHPLAVVSSRAVLGRGTYVCGQACIAGAVTIGDHVTICPGAIVGHDATIGDYSILAPGSCISGSVCVGKSCYVGARAVVRPGVDLASGALIGMGAVVVHPVDGTSVVVGNPARPIHRKDAADRAVVKREATDCESSDSSYISGNCVDVIVPCYKYGHLLRDAVTSVLNQRGVRVRVMIIDDCSPDDTEAVGRTLAAEDARVEYYRHAINQGHLKTFNEGLERATGEYTLLLSADDVVAPGALRRAACLLDAHPNVGFVYGQAITFRDVVDPTKLPRESDNFPTRIIDRDAFLRDACTSGDNVVLTPTVVVRTSLQHKLGGYLAPLVHAGDFEMWMRFAAHSDIGYIDGPQAFYRMHGANMSSAYSLLRDIEQRSLAFDELFTAHADTINDAALRRREATTSLATSAFWAGSHLFDRGDFDGCAKYHDLAMKIDPSFRLSASWLKFRAKRAIGTSVWSAIRPLVSKWKGRTAT